MTFTVNHDDCVGCGACESTCPAVFELRAEKSHVKLNPVPAEHQAGALEAQDGCPQSAISHA